MYSFSIYFNIIHCRLMDTSCYVHLQETLFRLLPSFSSFRTGRSDKVAAYSFLCFQHEHYFSMFYVILYACSYTVRVIWFSRKTPISSIPPDIVYENRACICFKPKIELLLVTAIEFHKADCRNRGSLGRFVYSLYWVYGQYSYSKRVCFFYLSINPFVHRFFYLRYL